MVVECAFEEYQEAFIKGYATQEDVQFVAVLAITMTLTAKHLFLKLGDGAPYLAAADLGRIYSISQSTVAATNRILLQKLELKPLADAEGEVLIQTAVVLDFLRSLNEWVISYGHAPETRNIITKSFLSPSGNTFFWTAWRKTRKIFGEKNEIKSQAEQNHRSIDAQSYRDRYARFLCGHSDH